MKRGDAAGVHVPAAVESRAMAQEPAMLAPVMLAQDAFRASMSILWWLAVIIGIVVVTIVVALWLRRRLQVADEEPAPIGFTLGDLRRMHRDGELSDAEFETARAAMIARSKADVDRPKPAPRRAGLGADLLAAIDEHERDRANADDDEPDEPSTDNSEDPGDTDNPPADSGPRPSR